MKKENLVNKSDVLEIGMKPVGLWYSIDNAWFDWCVMENFDTNHVKAATKYLLNIDESKIIKLISENDVYKFTEKYGPVPGKYNFKNSEIMKSSYIDWPRLNAEGWFGFECTPYHYALRTQNVSWYYSLDVPGGCIWNVGAIISIEKLK